MVLICFKEDGFLTFPPFFQKFLEQFAHLDLSFLYIINAKERRILEWTGPQLLEGIKSLNTEDGEPVLHSFLLKILSISRIKGVDQAGARQELVTAGLHGRNLMRAPVGTPVQESGEKVFVQLSASHADDSEKGSKTTSSIPLLELHWVDEMCLCPVRGCDQGFPSMEDLVTHVTGRAHLSNVSSGTCPICSHPSRGGLLMHVQLHFDLELPCSECSTKFRGQKQLDKHKIQVHTDNWRTTCEKCGLSISKSYVKNHMKLHDPASWEECRHCKVRVPALHLHEAFCERRNVYHVRECPRSNCDQTFTDSETLQRHVVRVHCRKEAITAFCQDVGLREAPSADELIGGSFRDEFLEYLEDHLKLAPQVLQPASLPVVSDAPVSLVPSKRKTEEEFLAIQKKQCQERDPDTLPHLEMTLSVLEAYPLPKQESIETMRKLRVLIKMMKTDIAEATAPVALGDTVDDSGQVPAVPEREPPVADVTKREKQVRPSDDDILNMKDGPRSTKSGAYTVWENVLIIRMRELQGKTWNEIADAEFPDREFSAVAKYYRKILRKEEDK